MVSVSNCAGDWQHHSQPAKVPVLHVASNLLLRRTEGELELPFSTGEKETAHTLTGTKEGTKAKRRNLLPGETHTQRG